MATEHEVVRVWLLSQQLELIAQQGDLLPDERRARIEAIRRERTAAIEQVCGRPSGAVPALPVSVTSGNADPR
jgi:hypothetical protein